MELENEVEEDAPHTLELNTENTATENTTEEPLN
jgi:hypothetical protein